jgi:hypothetical protein
LVCKKENEQIISKERVANHGEVYTAEREVNAMLDLVKFQTQRIESTFLEPACGTGNFLVEILRRKLDIVVSKYKRKQYEFEFYSIIAVSSLYGIDILSDNVEKCRERLFDIFNSTYQTYFNKKAKESCKESVRYILSKNIILGDALTLKRVDGSASPIIFCEWTPIGRYYIQRKDYEFAELLKDKEFENIIEESDHDQMMIDFGQSDKQLTIDYTQREESIFKHINTYPLQHFLELKDV